MSFAAPPAVTAQVPFVTGGSVWQVTSVGVFLQFDSQPSPLTLLPSSHSSPGSTLPFPQSALEPSWVHADEHPSPLTLLPSSHSSPGSTLPLPQKGPPSFVHDAEHPSPLTLLPSSHSSPGSKWPLPQSGLPTFSIVHSFEHPSPEA